MADDPTARLLNIADRVRAGGSIEAKDAAFLLDLLGRKVKVGERRPSTRLRLAERDLLICQSAEFFQGSQANRAREIVRAQMRLASTAWMQRRPPAIDDKPRVLLWRVLELNDGEPLGERRIRQILAESVAYSLLESGGTTTGE